MRPPIQSQNRVVAAICVGGAHLFIFWLIWDIHYAAESVVEDFAGVLLFMPTTTESPRPLATDKPIPRVRRPHERSEDLPDLPAVPFSGIALPATTSAPTSRASPDWQQALQSVATDVIGQAKEDAARLARIGRPPPSASFEPLHTRPHDLAWVGRHSQLVINAQGVPEWVLLQPCAVVILQKDPDCTVEHVERHGFTYEFIQQQHDATLGYDGPNAVP
jgi:hypothetical protein